MRRRRPLGRRRVRRRLQDHRIAHHQARRPHHGLRSGHRPRLPRHSRVRPAPRRNRREPAPASLRSFPAASKSSSSAASPNQPGCPILDPLFGQGWESTTPRSSAGGPAFSHHKLGCPILGASLLLAPRVGKHESWNAPGCPTAGCPILGASLLLRQGWESTNPECPWDALRLESPTNWSSFVLQKSRFFLPANPDANFPISSTMRGPVR